MGPDDHEVPTGAGIELRRNRRHLSWVTGPAAAAALASWALAADTTGPRQALNVLATVILLVATVLASMMLLRRSVAVTVTDAGIHDRTRPGRHRFVAWEHLAAVTTWESAGTSGITLDITETGGGTRALHLNTDALTGGTPTVLDAVTSHPRYQGRAPQTREGRGD